MVEPIVPFNSLTDVKRLWNILVFAVLALWLPAANHCRLEQIPGLGFLSCCTHEEVADTHHEDDCQTDGCATVEAGLYKSEGNQVVVGMPAVILVGLLPSLLDGLADPQCISRVRQDAVPPELASRWQFSLRAAAPPRAPSFPS